MKIYIIVIIIIYQTSRYWDSTHKEIHESKSWYSSRWGACSFRFLFGLFSLMNFISSLYMYRNKNTHIIVVIIVVVVIVYDTSRYWDSTHKEIHESKSWYSSSRWACSFGFLFWLFSFINFVSSLCSAKKFIFSINDVCNCFMYMVELFQIWNTVILSLIMETGMVNWVRFISFKLPIHLSQGVASSQFPIPKYSHCIALV